jgi:hypothetical protein
MHDLFNSKNLPQIRKSKFPISPLSLPTKIKTRWLQSFLKKPICTGTN